MCTYVVFIITCLMTIFPTKLSRLSWSHTDSPHLTQRATEWLNHLDKTSPYFDHLISDVNLLLTFVNTKGWCKKKKKKWNLSCLQSVNVLVKSRKYYQKLLKSAGKCVCHRFFLNIYTHTQHTYTHIQTQLPSEKSLLFCSKICSGCENDDILL